MDKSRAIPYITRCVASGGERKPSLITRYRSSKSTARNMFMVSDLEGSDQTAEIVPNGGSGIDKGIRRVLEGIWNPFDCHSGGKIHPRRN